MNREITVLVTGIGAPGSKGTVYALEAGAEASNVKIRTVGIDVKDRVAAKGFCDAVHSICNPASADYGQRLQDICESEKVDVILPQTTKEIEWLSKNQASFLAAKIVVAKNHVLEIANNKLNIAEAFASLGIPTPRFFRAKSEAELINAAKMLGYPEQRVVAKLPFSNGMRGLRILNEIQIDFAHFLREKPSGVECTLNELLKILHTAPQWPELMLCEYLEGQEYSVDCYIGRSGEIAIPRVRNEIRSGISFVTSVVKHEELIDYSLRSARAIGLDGVFGFQFKEGSGVPKLLECNPRVQGTMVASLVTGNNIIWAAVADALPDQVPSVNLSHPWTGGVCYRYWGATLCDGNLPNPSYTVV